MTNSTLRAVPQPGPAFWISRREAALNWLAFGVLLAAWNASDDVDAGARQGRPHALLAHSLVSVRAAQRAAAD